MYKKLLLITIASFSLTILHVPSVSAAEPIKTESADARQQIQTRQEIIGWRYKKDDYGRVYRRQYNYSRQIWLGEWELCP